MYERTTFYFPFKIFFYCTLRKISKSEEEGQGTVGGGGALLLVFGDYYQLILES